MNEVERVSDKEIIEYLKFCDEYEIAFRIKELKKENADLKRKLTKVQNQLTPSGDKT